MRALITGATRGIGLELLSQMAAGGVEVTGTYRSDPGTGPQTAAWVEMDVNDPASIKRATETLEEPLDLLICNAGIFLDKGQSLDTGFPAQMWADGFETNVTGVFLTIQALLPKLAASGKIAIISSQMASSENAPGGSYIYRASKAAVLNLGRNLACDLKPRGIAVGIYHPGWVQTDMGGAAADLTVSEAATGLIGRFAELNLTRSGVFEAWDGQPLPY